VSLEGVAAAQTPHEQPLEQRPGLWRAGSVYITPKLRIGTLGLDSNVFYTPTERQADFTASGGPGLEFVLPLGSLELRSEGYLDYLYFARTESQRRWSGGARGQLRWERGRVELDLEQAFTRTFQRPSFEVDRRVLQDQWTTRADLVVRMVGGLSLALQAARLENEVEEDAAFLGADLTTSLTREETKGVAELRQSLTPKTSLVLGGDQQADRFPLDESRDGDSNRVYGGFLVESTTRLSGRAVGGVRFYRPLDESRGEGFREPYVEASLEYVFGPRTELGARCLRDLHVSAFDPTSGAPLLTRESYELRLIKGLPARFDIQVFGSRTTLTSLASITVVGPGGSETAIRDDEVWQAGADLGFRFRSHYRLAFGATYTDRRSRFDDFGIEGLLLGATLTYIP
jgi:hypothetical protein